MPSILVVDDEVDLLRALCMILRSRGYQVREVSDGEEAARLLATEHFNLLVSDVRIGAYSGLDLLALAAQERPEMPVVMITAHATLEVALAAIKAGAFDFITKPFQTECFLTTVQRALEQPRLVQDAILLEAPVHAEWLFHGIVARSDGMRNVCRNIERLAPTTAALWLSAERGSGRRLVAELVHKLSSRRARPLVSLDCTEAASPEWAVRVFGAAGRADQPLLKKAEGGTLLMEHADALPLPLQERFLLLAQHGEYRACESQETIPADVRLILTTAERQGAAPPPVEDLLLSRMGVIKISLPPLRQRTEDLLPLISYLAVRESQGAEGAWRLDPAAHALLERYAWPGNLDELTSVVQTAMAAAADRIIRTDNLPEAVRADAGGGDLQQAVRREDLRGISFREYIRRQQQELTSKVRRV